MEQEHRRDETADTDPDVVVDCPACGRTPHVVLKEDSQATVKCTECGHVHKVKVQKPETVERRVVVSQGEDSFSTRSPMESDEFIQVGDEFVLESDEGIFGVEVTSVEVTEEDTQGTETTKRVESATADEVETVWTRTVDNVNVDVTVHSEGDSEGTKVRLPGDYSVVVGETLDIDGRSYEITAFITDDGTRLRYEGDDVEAKNAKRVYVES
ncbi:MAG: HVO_0476 family zinc finger protein [Halobacteria archaeon]|nr:HVO_0476 family zinc finger protein [Halobacteria archaeon]